MSLVTVIHVCIIWTEWHILSHIWNTDQKSKVYPWASEHSIISHHLDTTLECLFHWETGGTERCTSEALHRNTLPYWNLKYNYSHCIFEYYRLYQLQLLLNFMPVDKTGKHCPAFTSGVYKKNERTCPYNFNQGILTKRQG